MLIYNYKLRFFDNFCLATAQNLQGAKLTNFVDLSFSYPQAPLFQNTSFPQCIYRQIPAHTGDYASY